MSGSAEQLRRENEGLRRRVEEPEEIRRQIFALADKGASWRTDAAKQWDVSIAPTSERRRAERAFTPHQRAERQAAEEAARRERSAQRLEEAVRRGTRTR